MHEYNFNNCYRSSWKSQIFPNSSKNKKQKLKSHYILFNDLHFIINFPITFYSSIPIRPQIIIEFTILTKSLN